MRLNSEKLRVIFFRYLVSAGALAMMVVLAVYAYLGTFSRYLSDDYCEAVRVNRSSPVSAVIERFSAGDWRAANRYSNLLFVGYGELLGPDNMQITMALMVVLWGVGLACSVHQTRKFFNLNWPVQTDCFLGFTLGFFVLLQAPNLFQTVYWRSSMMTHFAPLVFGSFLFAFVMKQVRHVQSEPLSFPAPVYLTVFFVTFLIAGFSEPPVATMVTALGLTMLLVWFVPEHAVKRRILVLLAWMFAGAMLGLLVMVFSPASANMVQDSTPGPVEILGNSFLFSWIFITSSAQMFPLPTAITGAIPFIVIWLYYYLNPTPWNDQRNRQLWIMIVAVPVLMWVLIAAGFSPSVYGQGFPVERMRFMARFLMTAALMFEGCLFALLVQNQRSKQDFRALTALIFFILLGFVYPLRAAFNIYTGRVPEYHARAELWDLRDEYIIRHARQGERDIIVPGFSGVYSIKEIDDDPNHWVNICAAQYYELDSLRSVAIPDEYLLEYLSE
jgi:hypothetical protein